MSHLQWFMYLDVVEWLSPMERHRKAGLRAQDPEVRMQQRFPLRKEAASTMRSSWLLAAALCAATGLQGTVLTPLTNADLVARADAIVIGRCTAIDSRWEDRNLFTYSTIDIQETLKGPARARLTLVLPGGVDLKGPIPIAMDFEGGPVVRPGEQVFLFLRQIEGIPNGFAIVGFSQGKFDIRRGKQGAFVTRDLTGIYFARGQTAPRITVPLPTFKAEIKRLLATRSTPATPTKKTP